MKELVTIVVPVYNAKKYLEKCFNSLVNQTYENIEIIAINDGSKDETLNMLETWQKKDERIKVYNQKNIGAALTRNRGIKLAKGKYVTFVDSDDWIEKNYIETLVYAFKKDCDIIISGYQKYYDNKIFIHMPSINEWDVFKFSATLGKMYRLTFLNENNNFYKKRLIMEDVEFNINCFINGARYKTIKYTGYIYNINDDSVTSSSSSKHEQLENAVDLFDDINKKAESKDGFSYKSYQNMLINFYILHYMFIINMCCKKASLKYLLNVTKKFVSFLNKIDNKWYKINSPIGENKKNAFAIQLFKNVYQFKVTRLFFIMYLLKNKLKNRKRGI